MILAIPRCMSQHVMIITILHFNLLVVFVLQDASPHFKSNQEFFAFSRAQRQKALWNHQPSWWFSFIQKKTRISPGRINAIAVHFLAMDQSIDLIGALLGQR